MVALYFLGGRSANTIVIDFVNAFLPMSTAACNDLFLFLRLKRASHGSDENEIIILFDAFGRVDKCTCLFVTQ